MVFSAMVPNALKLPSLATGALATIRLGALLAALVFVAPPKSAADTGGVYGKSPPPPPESGGVTTGRGLKDCPQCPELG